MNMGRVYKKVAHKKVAHEKVAHKKVAHENREIALILKSRRKKRTRYQKVCFDSWKSFTSIFKKYNEILKSQPYLENFNLDLKKFPTIIKIPRISWKVLPRS